MAETLIFIILGIELVTNVDEGCPLANNDCSQLRRLEHVVYDCGILVLSCLQIYCCGRILTLAAPLYGHGSNPTTSKGDVTKHDLILCACRTSLLLHMEVFEVLLLLLWPLCCSPTSMCALKVGLLAQQFMKLIVS